MCVWVSKREGRGSNPVGTHIFLFYFIHTDKEKEEKEEK